MIDTKASSDEPQVATLVPLPLIIFVIAAIGMVVVPTFLDDLIYFFVVFPAVTIAWIVLACWSATMCVRYAVRKVWRMSLLASIPPILMLLGILNPWEYVYCSQYLGDRLHFAVMRPEYDRKVASLPRNRSRFAEFNWGGMLFASRGVVYDESDEVALPYGDQSEDWKRRMKSTDLTCGGDGPVGEVIPLTDHYYVVGFGS